MPICASSIPDALKRLLACLILAAPAAPVCALEISHPGPQETGAHRTLTNEPNASDRLKAAMDARRPASTKGPASIPDIPHEERSRTFERLKARSASPDLESRARSARDRAATQLETQREAMTARLHQALGLAPPEPSPATRSAQDGRAGARSTSATWVPVLFVSSSMPIETLRTYAGQLERARGVLAFRGVPGGLARIEPMARLSARILRRDPGCEGPACAMRDVELIVDPLLFRQQGIARVPALAMIAGDPTRPYCEREDDLPARANHLVLGDAALSGLLEEYGRIGGGREVRDAQARLSSR